MISMPQKGRTLQQYINKKMKNPEFKKCWNDLDEEFETMEEIIKISKKTGMAKIKLLNKNKKL